MFLISRQRLNLSALLFAALIGLAFVHPPVVAAQNGEDLNLQVSPSPLAVTLRPGESKTIPMTVRNLAAHAESLRPQLKGFDISSDSKRVSFSSTPVEIASWIHFDQSVLLVPAGGEKQLNITYTIPREVGFTYTVAIILEHAQKAVPQPGSTVLEGSIATFNLITIDRSDAKQALSLESFTPDKKRYEFLPASFSLTLKNTGNTITRPTGNIFIQRSSSDKEPIAVLPINGNSGYILPDKSRTFSSSWDSGFPKFVTKQTTPGNTDSNLQWNWAELKHIRFGRYFAKAIVVYNDGVRDISVVSTFTFWVIPWRLIGLLLICVILLLTGIFAIGFILYRSVRKIRRRA